MSYAANFLKHPLIGEYCVTSPELVIRDRNAQGARTGTMRVGKVGSLVLLNADSDVKINPGREATWFGILTWVEPKKEVKKGAVRMCEIWWVYSKDHIAKVLKSGEAHNKKSMLKELARFDKKQAWVSNHFSDEPLDSIMTIPKSDEVKSRMKLSGARYVNIDVENDICEFVKF